MSIALPHRLLMLVAIAQAGCTATHGAAGTLAAPPAHKLVELGHPFGPDTLYWPTEASGFRLTSLQHGITPGGYFYSANAYAAPEHGGTHIDAPIHFAAGKATTDAIPLTRLIAPAVVLDMSARAAEDRDALLAVEDLERFERAEGAIAAGTIVLVRTDWSARWPDRLRYLGSDRSGDASDLHFPGISAAAARALVARQVAAVGIDTASIDHGPSGDFPAHRILMQADIPAFENLAQLGRLPARGALLIALPMNIEGGSGGPLRAVAVLP
jgi:kynurenine formamidase